jgi:hypothetical protein
MLNKHNINNGDDYADLLIKDIGWQSKGYIFNVNKN